MTEKIPQHMHCQICGKAMSVSDTETVCSEECKQRYQAISKRRRLWVYLMYVLIFVMVGVLFLSSFIKI